MLKLILVAIACFMIPTASQAQSPISAMAKAKGDGAWCAVLPQACQLSREIDKAAARFKRGGRSFEAWVKATIRNYGTTPAETAP